MGGDHAGEVQTTAVAVYEPPQRAITKIDEWEETAESIRHNIDLSTPEGRSMYVACLSGEATHMQDLAPTKIDVVGYLIHVVDRTDDKTGEVKPGLRLAFALTNGSVVSTGSQVLIEAWAHIYRIYRKAEKWPTLRLDVEKVKRVPMGFYLRLKSFEELQPTQKPTKSTK